MGGGGRRKGGSISGCGRENLNIIFRPPHNPTPSDRFLFLLSPDRARAPTRARAHTHIHTPSGTFRSPRSFLPGLPGRGIF